MKKMLSILLVFGYIISFSMPAFAANDETQMAHYDLLFMGDDAQTSTNAVEPTTAREDSPVDENTYTEQPHNDTAAQLSDGETGRGEIENIDKYWARNGYPQDVSFAYEAGGVMVDDTNSISFWEIGIVGANENRKQEILGMLSSDCRVTFVDCQYSYSQREIAYNELLQRQDTNIQQIFMGANNEYVFVVVSADVLDEYYLTLNNQYGSLVSVTDENGIGTDEVLPIPGTSLNEGSTNTGNSMWLYTVIILALASIAFVVYQNRTRLNLAIQMTHGNVVTHSAPISKKATIDAIKKSEVSPSDKAFQSVLKKIDQRRL